MKVGVIGAGYWGKKHVDEYTQIGHEVVVSDLSTENLEFCKLNYNANPVKDYHKILNDKDITIVSICSPNSTHHNICIEALNANKNVLLEKPIGINSEQADEIDRLAKEKKKTLLIGHVFRFNNSIRKTKELMRTKSLGRVYTVNISWTNLEPIWQDRDILFDLGVHPLDILDNIFEKSPSHIYCTGEGFRQKNAEFAIINYHLNDSFGGKDIFVNIELSWLNPVRNRRMIIVGSEKTAIVDCVTQKIQLINNKSGVVEDVQIIPNNTIREELDFFITKSMNSERIESPAPNGEIGKRIVKIIERAQKSMNEKVIENDVF